jgi:benzoylformate decarboxylase
MAQATRPASSGRAGRAADRRTVRDVTYELLRQLGATTLFSNPGSTEISFLGALPPDFEFVLALHEGSVVAIATGRAIALGKPSIVLLHTTAGLGNAVSALATARVNRAPLVVLVGQQDRRHLAFEPFLTGRLEGLAGEYPVHVEQPVHAQGVPGAVARAWHEAISARGPALVIVPMNDWLEPAGEAHELAAPARLLRTQAPDAGAADELAAFIAAARSPVLVVGAGADAPDAWAALVPLAEKLGCPVWQEPFGSRPGFPQDHALFAGHLPAGRAGVRDKLAGHDVVIAVGAPVFRQFSYEPGPFVEPGTRVAIVSDDPAELHRAPVELAVLAAPGPLCKALLDRVPAGSGASPRRRRTQPPAPPAPGERLRAGHVFAALAERIPPDTVLLEESPSSRAEMNDLLPARRPLGFLSAAMGGLGFALPAAIGIRLAMPDRPVVAIVGDGSSIYQIQAVWSAAHYGVGPLFIVLANGRYAVMDRLAELQGAAAVWPGFESVDIAAVARGFGCDAVQISEHGELLRVLDDVVPTLRERREPLLLEIHVAP